MSELGQWVQLFMHFPFLCGVAADKDGLFFPPQSLYYLSSTMTHIKQGEAAIKNTLITTKTSAAEHPLGSGVGPEGPGKRANLVLVSESLITDSGVFVLKFVKLETCFIVTDNVILFAPD